jgi:riboflavin synthase
MFTGIIETVGKVRSSKTENASPLVISAPSIVADTKIGDSIAVDGVCLTVAAIRSGCFYFEVMPDTVRTTTLRKLKKGMEVNCERAALPTTRLGGHLVSGHVDAVGTIVSIVKRPNLYRLAFSIAAQDAKYVIPKGSIAVDGISLTVQEKSRNGFIVGIIPHTLQTTTLRNKKIKDKVNLEFDMLGKYIENILLDRGNSQSRLKKYLLN